MPANAWCPLKSILTINHDKPQIKMDHGGKTANPGPPFTKKWEGLVQTLSEKLQNYGHFNPGIGQNTVEVYLGYPSQYVIKSKGSKIILEKLGNPSDGSENTKLLVWDEEKPHIIKYNLQSSQSKLKKATADLMGWELKIFRNILNLEAKEGTWLSDPQGARSMHKNIGWSVDKIGYIIF